MGAASDVGRTREVNQDSFLARSPFFAVADGLGGHQGGEVASAIAVEVIGRRVDPARVGDRDHLIQVVTEANLAVIERASGDPSLRGMGTTCTLLALDGLHALLAHVGDSRGYRFRDGRLEQITQDHTLVGRMVLEGQITADEARTHPVRSTITRALGFDPRVEVDIESLHLTAGERVLLCSDGLYGMVDADAIAAVLAAESDPQAAAQSLVQLANEAGGEDNITALVVDVPAPAEEAVDSAGPDAATDITAVTPTFRPPTPAGGSERAPRRTKPAPRPREPRSRRAVAPLLLLLVGIGVAVLAFAAYLLLVPAATPPAATPSATPSAVPTLTPSAIASAIPSASPAAPGAVPLVTPVSKAAESPVSRPPASASPARAGTPPPRSGPSG